MKDATRGKKKFSHIQRMVNLRSYSVELANDCYKFAIQERRKILAVCDSPNTRYQVNMGGSKKNHFTLH